MYLMCVGVSAQPTEPIYAHSLRHIPEKLRQERILHEVKTRLEQVTQVILHQAQHQTETNFTLFCHEPNDYPYEFHKYGNIYTLSEVDKHRERTFNGHEPIYPKPKCSLKDGYELYRRSTINDQTNRYTPVLYDTPIVSIQMFFNYFNQQFPDLRLTILHERDANKKVYDRSMGIIEPIFETDCCPLYIVSWKE